MATPPPDLLIPLPDGRVLAVDDRGDAGGTPVLYLHGTPDSRLARHPDDSIAAALGVRLIAVDRPGIGDSSPDGAATPASVAADLVTALDHLGVERASVLSWSAGSIHALAFAGAHPRRVARLAFAAPLVPADAYDDAGVLDGADDSRRLFVESLGHMTPDDLGRELAMWLVPPEIDAGTAEAMLETSLRAVADIPGAAALLVAAVQASVAGGMSGIERDLAAQATPLGDLLDAIDADATIHVGTRDTVAPPAMGSWLARRLGAPVTTHEGEGHALAITCWRELLASARSG